MKIIVFLNFEKEKQEKYSQLLENNPHFKPIFIDSVETLFENVFNKEEHYSSIFLPDTHGSLKEEVLKIRNHLKISVNVIKISNADLSGIDVDNFIHENASKEEYRILFKASEKITDLMDTSIDISNNFYHFEFFKRIIHIEIKRAKRYGIELSLLYLTFNNVEEIKAISENQFELLFKEFNNAVTTSIRDIDIPIAFGSEAILLMMPHTNKGGANVVAERIYAKLMKTTSSVNFSISVVSPKKEDLSFSTMMRKIHEGIEVSVSKGGKSIIVN